MPGAVDGAHGGWVERATHSRAVHSAQPDRGTVPEVATDYYLAGRQPFLSLSELEDAELDVVLTDLACCATSACSASGTDQPHLGRQLDRHGIRGRGPESVKSQALSRASVAARGVAQARRAVRDSGPGLGPRLPGVGHLAGGSLYRNPTVDR